MTRSPCLIHRIQPDDTALMAGLMDVFGEAFEDRETYGAHRPDEAYWRSLLGGDSFIALAALDGDRVVGGLAAYELKKFEQRRSEIYIYDLAVAETHRRRGIASALIEGLASGSITRQKIWKEFAPSSRAASSNSAGIDTKNCRIKKVPKALKIVGMTMPCTVSNQPRFWTI